MEKRESLNLYLQYAIRDNWDRLSMSDFDGISLQYRDVARKIEKLHILFEMGGVRVGDKIALCGRNTTHWGVAFLAIVTYGAVAVPILHEFHPDSVANLLAHSDSSMAFFEKSIFDSLSSEKLPSTLLSVFDISDFSLLYSTEQPVTDARHHLNMMFGEKYPERFTPSDFKVRELKPTDLAVINYTSGSTGTPKGVMLSHRALYSNLQFCIDGLTFLKPGDGVVCMLPLAHMFGLMVDLLHCFTKGCHIHFITRLPSPHVLLGAMARVRPKLVVSVPLVIEKIIRGNVFPALKTNMMRIATAIPGVKGLIYTQLRQRIIDAFGGNLKQLIIGGASPSKEVEEFLRKIKFPFTVGYGMTECAPLISYAPWDQQRPGSCGRIVDRMQAKIDSPDPANTPGVLWVKGDNVMDGYYKNPQATKEAFDDGWMQTGDICTLDPDGYLYIRGRSKTMILGPSGQNIYPEEIESVLNTMPSVGESLVVTDDNGKLQALVFPDPENKELMAMTPEQVDAQVEADIAKLNEQLPAYSKVASKRIMDKEFEKTPKRSIKRYLYQ